MNMWSRILITAVALLLTATGAAARAVSPLASPVSVACTPTVETIHGVSVSVSCGPAKASVTYKGKTYKFSVGRCHKVGGAYFVNIGKSAALGDTPVAYAFDVGVSSYPKPHDGTYHTTVTLVWQIPGKRFQLKAPYNVTLSGKLTKGTFSGTVLRSGPAVAKGSWTC
jgi:hypothetical protein